MFLSINGTDLTSYIAEYSVTYKKVLGANSVTTLDGKFHEDVLARKAVVKADLVPTTAAVLASIESLCSNDTVTVIYTDTKTNANVSATMIPQLSDANILINYPSTVWGGHQLVLEEQ